MPSVPEDRQAAPPFEQSGSQAEPVFEMSGGALCLDFANTWSDRGRPETDKLCGYADLLAFARQAGLLDVGEGSRLADLAARERRAAAAALDLARGLREVL